MKKGTRGLRRRLSNLLYGIATGVGGIANEWYMSAGDHAERRVSSLPTDTSGQAVLVRVPELGFGLCMIKRIRIDGALRSWAGGCRKFRTGRYLHAQLMGTSTQIADHALSKPLFVVARVDLPVFAMG